MSEIHALSGAYAVDALDDVERARFEAHLAECADCRAEVDSLREAAAMLGSAEQLAPPPALRGRLLEDVSRVRPLPPRSGGTGAARSTWRRAWLPTLAIAASVLLVLGLVTAVWRPWQDDGAARPSAAERVLAAPDAQRVEKDMHGTPVTVVRSMRERRAVLLVNGMPAPPAGRAYELWFQTPKGEMVPAGVLPAGPDHAFLLDGDATEAVGVGITVEPKAGSDRPTTDPVALFDLTGGAGQGAA
jgi:anti-sigma-K factor RskA